MSNDVRAPFILYDGDCPVCSAYVRHLRLRRAIGQVALVNGRDRTDLVAAFRDQGMEINDGFIFHDGNKAHWGADAMIALAILTTPSSWLNRINATLFRSNVIARTVYPLLRIGRRALLGLRGIPRIS